MQLPDARSTTVESVQFAAGPYFLEGELTYPDEGDDPSGAVVLAGSHPFLGGNMHNNVVRGLGDGLAEQGLATLRFNYRSVSGSGGPPIDVAQHLAEFWETSHAPGEMDLWQDVQAAADFLRRAIGPATPVTLIGYSFGCALLPLVQLPQPPAALILIAPPLGRHTSMDFRTAESPLLVIVSEDDFTLEPARLHQWFDQLPNDKRLVQAARDNHFFRGRELWLVDTVWTFLREQGL